MLGRCWRALAPKHRWIGAGLVGLLACFAATVASASTQVGTLSITSTPASQLTPAAVTALQRVQGVAGGLPPATTPAIAASNQAALKSTVLAAVAASPAAENALWHTTDLDVAADMLRFVSQQPVEESGTGTPPPLANGHLDGTVPAGALGAHAELARTHARHRARAAGCWGTIWHTNGTDTMLLRVQFNGWCGNGSSITWYGGASFWHSVAGPFCITNLNTDYSWEVPFSWIHGGIWASEGVPYPWGCAVFTNTAATMRIAANGYWDTGY